MKMPAGERPEVRIVGSGAPEEKEKLGKQILSSFGEGHGTYIPEDLRELIRATEQEKTENELIAIAEANNITNELLRGSGLPEFDIPPANIHFIPREVFAQALGEHESGSGATYIAEQAIAINADESRQNAVWDNEIILHEMIHLKGYSAFEVDAEGKRRIFRSGLGVGDSPKKRKGGENSGIFHWLNEAIVTEITTENLAKLINSNAQLTKEREWLQSEKSEKLKEKIAGQLKIDPEEFLWLDEKGGITHPYRAEREVLDYIIEAISQDQEFQPDEVRDKFFKVHFTGHLLEIAHLIEKTFGKSSFEVLSMIDAGTNQQKIMDYLKRHRRLTNGAQGEQ